MGEIIYKGFCSSCGMKLRGAPDWPRSCPSCKSEYWDNPVPIVATIVPVIGGGVIVGKRAIDPGYGMWNLLAGFMEKPLDWRGNAAREVGEETNWLIRIDPASLTLVDAYSTSPEERGDKLILFAVSEPVRAAPIRSFTRNAETLGLKVVRKPIPLAFTSHTRNLERYFKGEFDHVLRKARSRK